MLIMIYEEKKETVFPNYQLAFSAPFFCFSHQLFLLASGCTFNNCNYKKILCLRRARFAFAHFGSQLKLNGLLLETKIRERDTKD